VGESPAERVQVEARGAVGGRAQAPEHSRRTDRRKIRTASKRGEAHACQHAEHPEAERQQPDRPDLRAGRRARTLYPLLARATYPTLQFPQYAGEVATADVDDELKAKAARDAEEALARPLEVYNTFFLAGKRFIGGDHPSIADMRFAATLEFLRAIDYDLPSWAEEYIGNMEDALGEAYTEPAADVRGYVESVKTPA